MPVIIILTLLDIHAQNHMEKLPYYEIPEYPESYHQGTVAARMIDGLGYRYYWATESLREEDLNFKPNDEARSIGETLDHILDLSSIIVNATLIKVNEKSDFSRLTFDEKRSMTLNNLKTASNILKNSKDLSLFKIVFSRDDGVTEFPFWNQINGPISDAIWHCGQVVLLRRSSGNPYNAKANLFTGKVRN